MGDASRPCARAVPFGPEPWSRRNRPKGPNRPGARPSPVFHAHKGGIFAEEARERPGEPANSCVTTWAGTCGGRPWRACLVWGRGRCEPVEGGMDLRALIFDVNGTLVDLETDEGRDDAFRLWPASSSTRGCWSAGAGCATSTSDDAAPARRLPGGHPEIDVVSVWRELLEQQATARTRACPREGAPAAPVPGGDAPGADAGPVAAVPRGPRGAGTAAAALRLAVVSDHQTPYGLPECGRGAGRLLRPGGDLGRPRLPQARPPALRHALQGVRARRTRRCTSQRPVPRRRRRPRRGHEVRALLVGPVKAHPFSTPAACVHHFAAACRSGAYLAGRD